MGARNYIKRFSDYLGGNSWITGDEVDTQPIREGGSG